MHLPPYCDGAFTYSHARHHVITASHHHVTTSSRRTHAHGALSRTRPPCTAFIHSAHIAYGALWPVPSGLYSLACTLWPRCTTWPCAQHRARHGASVAPHPAHHATPTMLRTPRVPLRYQMLGELPVHLGRGQRGTRRRHASRRQPWLRRL